MPIVIDNTSETNQVQLQVNQQQVTDPLNLTVETGSNINKLLENHKAIDQRQAISKCFDDGLRQLNVSRGNDASTLGVAASSSAAATLLQPGKGAVRQANIDNQMTVHDSLMINQVKAAQTHLQANLNLNRTTAVPIRINNGNISLSESQAYTEQRDAITKFLADGLRQLMANHGNANYSRVMGSLAIKSCLIKIDLVALGTTSLNIVVNIPDQNNMDGPSFGSKLMLQEPLVPQPKQYLLVSPVIAMNKPAQITKVYYRRRFKNKGGSYEKQVVLVDHSSENIGNIFGNNQVTTETLVDSSNKGENSKTQKRKIYSNKGENYKSQKRESNTPTTTINLRRSPRFIEKLDGHKPAVVPTGKAHTRNKNKGKKVKPQTDLLGNILLSPTCHASEFPSLSTIVKHSAMGTIVPQIPVIEIQKLATETCCIPPSEVTAELLLDSRPEDEAGGLQAFS
jgi:hypothetical protein